jgi:hypothetical protein
MENYPNSDLPFSSDPEENLRMENEVLRLKLKAELGTEAHFIADLPAHLENEFLKNILSFENTIAGKKQIKVFDLLGKPDFIPAGELYDEDIELAFDRITELLNEKQIVVDFSGTYDSRTKYKFITEELFELETHEATESGMFIHFNYEDFHPNHSLDIVCRTEEFLSQWFDCSLDNHSWELADTFILADGQILRRETVVQQLKEFFDCYTAFKECEYFISDIQFELKEDCGIGHAEGTVKYKGMLDNQEEIQFTGPFKLYFTFDYEWWSIFYFIFPGFKFHSKE